MGKRVGRNCEVSLVAGVSALEGAINIFALRFQPLGLIACERPRETRYTQSQILISPTSMTSQPPEATSQNDPPVSEPAPVTTTDATPDSDAVDSDEPSFGWNAYGERLNGRFAMIGFMALLITQLFTRQDFWTWIGL